MEASSSSLQRSARPSVLGYDVAMLGTFRVTHDDVPVLIPASTWRLVAFLSLADRPVSRNKVALDLWCDKDEARAQANLRSALWRLGQAAPGLVACMGLQVRLGDQVRVDLRKLADLARDLDGTNNPAVLQGLASGAVPPELFTAELLPDWCDEFVDVERERVRQLRLHTLEALGQALMDAGAYGKALQCALAAVSAAPMRESAHRLVIAIHLAEGNVSEALRQFERLKTQLNRELGIGPSASVMALMAPWLACRTPSASPRLPARRI